MTDEKECETRCIYNIVPSVPHCHICLSEDAPLLLTCARGTCHGFLVHPSCYVDLLNRGIVSCAACHNPYILKVRESKRECVCVCSPRASPLIVTCALFSIAFVCICLSSYYAWLYGALGVWVCVVVGYVIVGYICIHESWEVPCRCAGGEVTVGY